MDIPSSDYHDTFTVSLSPLYSQAGEFEGNKVHDEFNKSISKNFKVEKPARVKNYSESSQAQNINRKPSSNLSFSSVVETVEEENIISTFKNRFIKLIIQHFGFRTFMMIIILGNIVVLALDSTRDNFEEQVIYSVLDVFCVTIYVFEIIINWISDFYGYWTDGWNIFDFIIIIISAVGLIIDVSFENSTIEALRVMKSMRVFRIIHRLIVFLPIHNTIFLALPMIFLILCAFFIIIFIYSVIGLTIFSSDIPSLFGSLPSTLYTLFVVVTLESWPDVMNEAAKGKVFDSAAVYFISFTTLMDVIAMTLIIGILASFMQKKRRQMSKEQKELKRKSEEKYFYLKPPPSKNQLSWSTQIPINNDPSFHHVDLKMIGKMHEIKKAMESNLKELDEQINKLSVIIKKSEMKLTATRDEDDLK